VHRRVAELGGLGEIVVDQGAQLVVGGEALLDQVAGLARGVGLVEDVDVFCRA